jgi:energy-coupling factor transporter transmembrane protein EcfT
VVHWTHECWSTTLATTAILAIGTVLSATMPVLALALSLVLVVLRVSAKIPFTAPLFPVSRVMRMVGCIIHSVFTLWFSGIAGLLYAETVSVWTPNPPWSYLNEAQLNFFVKSSFIVSAFARASRTGTGGNLKT